MRQCLDARAGAEVEAAAAVRGRPARQGTKPPTRISAAEDLVPDEDEEPSADDEVDLATGEDDLGVETGGDETNDDEN
jgi:hypothetical protein